MSAVTILLASLMVVGQEIEQQPDTAIHSPSKTLFSIGAQVQTGFIIAHSQSIANLASSHPSGSELTISRMRLSAKSYASCHCLARVGAYVSYINFGNRPVLGDQLGVGVFFEPLLMYGPTRQLSVKTTAGVSYLNRVFDARTNPDNLFFSLPLSFWLGLSVNSRFRLYDRWSLTAAVAYNHISNGGIRQPNKGMNFPMASVGIDYALQSGNLPSRLTYARVPLTQRWTARAMLVGTVRVLPQTDAYPEQAKSVWGLILTGGYRLTRFHAFTGGLEFTHDGFVRGSIQREAGLANPAQLALLAGYELWQGRYTLAVHGGLNVWEPGEPYTQSFFQRYQLLYRINKRLTAGVGLKAYAQVAQGFDARLGVSL